MTTPNTLELTNLRHGEIYACPINGNPKGAWKALWEVFRSNRIDENDGFQASAEYEEMYDDRERCVLCGEPVEGYGHNPAPLSEVGRCCSTCNDFKVLPARIAQLQRGN